MEILKPGKFGCPSIQYWLQSLFLVPFAFIVACGQQSEDQLYHHPQEKEIKEALVQMLTKSTDPFLIVEDLKTENFIQFYNEDGRILIDLPEGAVAPERIGLAQGYFQKQGIPVKENQDIDPQSGKTFLNRSWTTTYPPEEAEKVVNIALGALFEIYGISDATPLTLTRGWE